MLPVHISNSFQVTGSFHVKKARLLQELQELTKQEEELRDLERQVEPARQRIRDRKTETVPKATQPTSEGKGNQPQCPPTMGTPSETDTHSGTAFDCPTALVPQPAVAHSAGYNGQVSTGDDSPDYAACLKHLIVMLLKKYRRTSLLSDLQEAIFRAQEMVVATSLDHPDRSAQIRDWINMMLMKFRHTGLQEDLYEAIITAREVGASVSADNIDGRGFVMKVGIPV